MDVSVRTALAVALISFILGLVILIIVNRLSRKYRTQLELRCKGCNKLLVIPHPIDGSRMMCGVGYVEGVPYCRECLIDHCMNTKCSECTINSKKKCTFYSTKKQYMEELVQDSKVVVHGDNNTVTIV